MTPPASPFISSGHWSHQVLRRLDNAGLLPSGADVARQSIPQEEIAGWLAYADSAAGTRYLENFREEYKAAKRGFVQRQVFVGGRTRDGAVAPGTGYDTANWAGARTLDDDTDILYGVSFGLTYAPHFALAVNSGFAGGEPDEPETQLIAAAGYVGAWFGFRKLGYGVGNGGGLVVNDYVNQHGNFPQFGVFVPRPLRLPLLGAMRFEMHAGKVDNVLNLNDSERDIEPWFWTARGSVEPFGIVRIGINRGMIFGGDGNTPVTFERVLNNIVGFYTNDGESNFANQVISIDFRVRVPGFPVSAYLDWGSDDAAGGWWDVPAILAGAEFTHVDSTFDIAVGAEHVQFARSCCGNSIWYRNAWFRGSWADGDELLGHPLGGHGAEWRVFGNGSWMRGRVNAHAALFTRRRREENILVPAWAGRSTGIAGGGDVRITANIRLLIGGEFEKGSNDWTAARLSAAARRRF